MLQARWLSAVAFNTPYRTLQQTFLRILIFCITRR